MDFNDNQKYINGSTQNKPSLQWDTRVYAGVAVLRDPERKRYMAKHVPVGKSPPPKAHPAVLFAFH